MHTHLLLEMAADAAPDRAIIGSHTTGMTLGRLLEVSRRAAAWMNGRVPGTVTYVGLNGPSFPVAIFAASMAGRPFTPLNYRLPDADLRKLLARSAPTLAICDRDMLERLQGVDGVDLICVEDFVQTYSATGNAPALPEPEQDVAVVLFTSGTTSEPKAAILRHRNVTSYVLSTVEFLGADQGDAALISVPPYHIAGITAVLTSIYSGRRMVQLAAFSPEAWVETAIAQGVTHAMVVPTMLSRILDVIDQGGLELPSLRALSYGGGRMPIAVVERAMDLLPGVDFVNAYGLTETSSTIAILDPDSHREARASVDPDVRRRLSSVGRPLPAVELEIRDEEGATLPAGKVGEVWVRGDQISGEYSNRKAIRDDGWFRTNDAGWLDHAGYLFVEGRLDDVIVRGGENISPSEVEDVLRLHSAVKDVAVLGLPDEEWGERIVAAVVVETAIAPDELRALVKSRLRSTRVPEEIFFRSSLPYNDSGKLLRRILKAELSSSREPALATVHSN
jgi:acyl-CoA synthetase (AMP-forming)/AMP-acid ligase II